MADLLKKMKGLQFGHGGEAVENNSTGEGIGDHAGLQFGHGGEAVENE